MNALTFPELASSKVCGGAVLVVDDDDILRETLCELLELQGFRAVGPRDGIEAMARLRGPEPVCFVVLDLLMPRMNGLQVLRALSDDPQFRGLGLCVSTATAEWAPLGVSLLPKPIDLDVLLSMIEASCASTAAQAVVAASAGRVRLPAARRHSLTGSLS